MPLVESVHFSNYRNFSDFTMGGLQRVNLIVGDSNVGKTGLLEGLVTLWGDDKQFKSLPNTFRMNYGDSSTSLENYWSWFYPEKNQSLDIKLASFFTSSKHEVYVDKVFKRTIKSAPDITVKYTDGVPHQVWGPSQLVHFNGFPYKINVLPIGIGDYQVQIDLFNKLSQKKGGEDQLVESLNVIESRLKGLRYLKVPPSNQAMVYADVGLDYKIPTTQFGHGFTRSMEMLSNLILSGSDIMIADEIENGIHYSALGSVWKAIIDYAAKNDVQIFATTHSRECIAAAHEAMQAQERYELNVIRLQNRKGEVVAINHSKEDIETAFDLGLPLR